MYLKKYTLEEASHDIQDFLTNSRNSVLSAYFACLLHNFKLGLKIIRSSQ